MREVLLYVTLLPLESLSHWRVLTHNGHIQGLFDDKVLNGLASRLVIIVMVVCTASSKSSLETFGLHMKQRESARQISWSLEDRVSEYAYDQYFATNGAKHVSSTHSTYRKQS